MPTCPSCCGKGEGFAIMCGSHCRTGMVKCSTCKGERTITVEHVERIKQSAIIRRDRIDRRLTLREEGKRLGVDFAEWSRIEVGNEPETEAGRRALATRMEEIKDLPPEDTTEARCPRCGYRYRGLDARKLFNPIKTYACKGCGVSVVFQRVEQVV